MRTPIGRVLVVDDDEPIRRLIRLNLELEGFEVEVAVDGRECLTKVRTRPPDVITLDLVMPTLDGLSTAARLRAAEHSRTIPLVLITGAATPRDRLRADEIGIEAVLAKPFQPADLVAAVRSVIGTTRAPNKSDERARSGH